jgi:hypothetical protein
MLFQHQHLVYLLPAGYESDQQVARTVPGLDVIIGGHSHTFLYSPTTAGPLVTRKLGATRESGGSALLAGMLLEQTSCSTVYGTAGSCSMLKTAEQSSSLADSCSIADAWRL